MCFGSKKQKGDDAAHNEHLNARPASLSKVKAVSSSSKMPQSYNPPAGPPSSHAYLGLDKLGGSQSYAPPPGPPPGQHDWQSAVPDTSLLPPPPMLGYETSPTNNATEDQANRAVSWCRENPLARPVHLAPQGRETIESGVYGLSLPPGFLGEGRESGPGRYAIRTRAGTPDTCTTSGLPMYCVSIHSPLETRRPKTIYFEVKIAEGAREIDLGLGFVAAPYPPFRLPGWERASLGVHGDDGRRYVNDRWGGKDFTQAFQAGETVGIGMTFSARQSDAPPSYSDAPVPAKTTAQTPIDVEVFFTRNGEKTGGWNLHEEGDADEDLPVTGLEGMNDLYASVGMFEAADFEIILASQDWLYQVEL